MILRRGFVFLLSIGLLVIFIVGAIAASTFINLSGPKKLEGWIGQGSFYNNFVSDAVSSAESSAKHVGTSGAINLSNDRIVQAAQVALPKQLFQQDINTFINSNYAWLQGKTGTPSFSIDLNQIKKNFADQVGKMASARLSSLPACTKAQLITLANQYQSVEDADSFSIACLPPSLDIGTVAGHVSQNVVDSQIFLDGNTAITPNSLDPSAESSGQPYYHNLTAAPKAYKIMTLLPWICGLLALLLILGIRRWAPSRRRAVRRFAVVLLLAGLTLILVKSIDDFLLRQIKNALLNSVGTDPLQKSLADLIGQVESHLVKVDFWFAIAYIAIAIMLFFYLFKTRGNNLSAPRPSKLPPSAPLNNPAPATPASAPPAAKPTPSSPLPPLKKPRPKRPRLIQ